MLKLMIALPIAAVMLATANAATTAPRVVDVTIENYAYHAPSIEIAPGAEVRWTNKDDDPHTVTADDGSFDSKGLGQGDQYDHIFSKPGRYAYHCAAHPFMKGVIVVSGDKHV